METWQPEDWAVLLMTVTICLSVLLSVISNTLLKRSISELQMDAIKGVILALVAVISLYVGSKIGG